MTGVRAELVFESTGSCPVAAASATTDGQLTDITWTAASDGSVTEQVTMTGECDPPSQEVPPDGGGDGGTDGESPAFEAVFDYGSRQVYEFERDSDPCICEYIEMAVGPVSDVYAADGDLHVTLHTADVAAMRELVSDLNEEFGTVRIEYLVRSRREHDDADLVPVDLRQLTARQREVLERAHELGYFEYPRQANASEVAESLDIGPSTFIEHVNAAQSKLLADLVGRE
jgi:hypothetical protein